MSEPTAPATDADIASPSPAAQAKYMAFRLAEEEYGIDLLSVREIIRTPDIVRFPRAQHFVRGLINLRGSTIPVIDTRARLGMDPALIGELSVIIVVRYQHDGCWLHMGLLVDQVLEVLSVGAAEVEPPPAEAAASGMVHGVGKVAGRIVFLLDVAKVVGRPSPTASATC